MSLIDSGKTDLFECGILSVSDMYFIFWGRVACFAKLTLLNFEIVYKQNNTPFGTFFFPSKEFGLQYCLL